MDQSIKKRKTILVKINVTCCFKYDYLKGIELLKILEKHLLTLCLGQIYLKFTSVPSSYYRIMWRTLTVT